MAKYRKKPVEIEAVQWTGQNVDEVKEFVGPYGRQHFFLADIFVIHTKEGQMNAYLGYWIIRGVEGEIYPCKPSVFATTYEPVEP